MRVGAALQPLATALFANSPFYEGKPNGLLSNRAQVWTDTDNARSGIPAVDFRGRVRVRGLCRMAARCADVFRLSRRRVSRCGRARRSGISWPASWRRCRASARRLGDFADHSTTAFPDVRLKRYIETRGADSGRPAMMLAQSAFWTGIFYDPAALAAAAALVKDLVLCRISWPCAPRCRRTGINTTFGAARCAIWRARRWRSPPMA